MAKLEEASVRVDALSGGGDAGRGLFRGWKSVCPGACALSLSVAVDDGTAREDDAVSTDVFSRLLADPEAEDEDGSPEDDIAVDKLGKAVDTRSSGKRAAIGLALGVGGPAKWRPPVKPWFGACAICPPGPKSIDMRVVGFVLGAPIDRAVRGSEEYPPDVTEDW